MFRKLLSLLILSSAALFAASTFAADEFPVPAGFTSDYQKAAVIGYLRSVPRL